MTVTVLPPSPQETLMSNSDPTAPAKPPRNFDPERVSLFFDSGTGRLCVLTPRLAQAAVFDAQEAGQWLLQREQILANPLLQNAAGLLLAVQELAGLIRRMPNASAILAPGTAGEKALRHADAVVARAKGVASAPTEGVN